MSLDRQILAAAQDVQQRLARGERAVAAIRADFNSMVRRLYANGGSLREIAAGTGLSFQRIHQIVDPDSHSRIRLTDRGDPDLRVECGFCDRGYRQVGNVLAGEEAHICDECVTVAAAALAQRTELGTAANTKMLPATDATPFVWCNFCRQYRRSEITVLRHLDEEEASALHQQCVICEDCVRQAARRVADLSDEANWVTLPDGGKVLP